MVISTERFKALMQLYREGERSWPQLPDDEYAELLVRVLQNSSPRLQDFPDKLIHEIMKSVRYLHADFVEIHEDTPHPEAFNGSVHFMEVHKHWFDVLLVKLGLKAPVWMLSSHSYQISFSFYR